MPQHIEGKNGLGRCVRLSDGRFHMIRPGPVTDLFWGDSHILASDALATVLRDTCSHCLHLRQTELIQVATGETFGVYYEVLPHDELTPDSIHQVRTAGFHAWHFHGANLFVSPALAEHIQQRGFESLSYSPGFAGLAGAAA